MNITKERWHSYNTEKGAFRGHPWLILTVESLKNTAWLIQHGMALLDEYTQRYGKVHSCQTAMNEVERIFEERTGKTLDCHKEATPFAFAGNLMSSSMIQVLIFLRSIKDTLHLNLG